MRRLILAAIGVLAVSGFASAQQPVFPAAPVQPAGATVIRGNGCTNCGPTTRGFTMSNLTGGNCQLGAPCQSGCGSVKSDLAFHFGSCKNFFSPCGPSFGHGGSGCLFSPKCGVLPFAAPWGQGFCCPRAYDSYANH